MIIIIIDKNIKDAIGLATNSPNIVRVGVFGSYSRGEANKDSDIDILFDYEDITQDIDGYFETLEKHLKVIIK